MTGEALHLFDMLAWQLARALPGVRAGSHRARLRGGGDVFADTAAFLAHPDPRRIDLRRSLTDPFESLIVRRFEARNDLTVHLLLDASASLCTGARSDRAGLARMLAAGIAEAAWRGRDRFAITAIGGDDVLLSLGASRSRSMPSQVYEAVATLVPKGRGVEGLVRIATSLPRDRILVVLISDFEHDSTELRQLLAALDPRPVWPLWLRDSGLETPRGHFGIAEIRDPETGRRRAVLTTRRWAAAETETHAWHRKVLRDVFSEFGLRPVEIRDQIDVAALATALDEAPL
ncbi:hypothetical protein [Breoghania sp. JC706]|uniref:DUF58 domain-containing protein n=1 Tax=Breoghania sp. JC706 TaxID=3117732 RepID=UPI00300B5FDD